MPAAWEQYLDSLAAFGMRPGLERVRTLLGDLGEPQHSFRCVHVVGTNGKSSTARYVAALLSAHGLRSGAYLSPHLRGYEERVVVDGAPIAAERFGRAVHAVRKAVRRLSVEMGETTQFEVLTVAAMVAFAEAGVEAAAVEAGLGGRLDATNMLAAPVVGLTNVALEHTDVLGPTREAIFAEKAAVIVGGDAVFGPLEGLEPLAEARCAEVEARAHLWGRDVVVRGDPARFEVAVRAGRRLYSGLHLSTAAVYQLANAALALSTADLLLGELDEARARSALAAVIVPGRLHTAGYRPLILADGAHNPHGMAALAASLMAIERPSPRVALLAMMGDKDVEAMLTLALPLAEQVVCTRASEPRSLSACELAARARASEALAGRHLEAVEDSRQALARAIELAGPKGSVLVTGSLYLLEDLWGTLVQRGGRDG